MPIVEGLPIHPRTRVRRWPVTTTSRELPRDPVGRVKVRIELIARALSLVDAHMFRLTADLPKAAPRMRPTEKKRVLNLLTTMHETWVLKFAVLFSGDALKEGCRLLTALPRPPKKISATAEAGLRRQLEGLGEGSR